MVPTPSWPRIRPSVTAGTSPLRMCRSVPQIVVVSTRTDHVGRVDDLGIGHFFPRLLFRSVVHQSLHENTPPGRHEPKPAGRGSVGALCRPKSAPAKSALLRRKPQSLLLSGVQGSFLGFRNS